MRSLWALALLSLAGLCSARAEDKCALIDATFADQTDPNETMTCNCFVDPAPADPSDNIWIGCTGHSMSTVFKQLGSLNETLVSRVHIWDSILNILPSEMFDKVRPRVLLIENSMATVVRQAAFSQIGSRLRELRLRNNAFKKTIDPNMLKGLDRLQVLDMSGNKLTTLRAKDLEAVGDLRELLLNGNAIGHIEDGAFEALHSLRTLSLQGNQITAITKDTFKGLDNLENLSLQHNQISSVDWSAFKHMKHLKNLDLGRNQLSTVELRGLEALEKLILNNNSIMSLKNVSLRDLPSLLMLSLDRNGLSEIDEQDLFGLAPSTRIESISMASNNLSSVSARAFQFVQHITILALQNNQLTSLSAGSTPVLRPLRRLSALLLSGNALTALREGELPSTLSTVAVDHNHISHIDAAAFSGMRPQRLYLNENRLTFLPKGTFDSFDMETLEAVDLTENNWQCVCGEEWLGKWLEDAADRDVGDGAVGCLAASCERENESQRSTWVTVSAVVLAVLSVVLLSAIAYVAITDGRRRMLVSRPFSKRVDSDLLKLINDAEPLDSKTDAARGVQPRARGDVAGTRKSVRFQNM